MCAMIFLLDSVQADGHGEYPPPDEGDWFIGKETYVGNETIQLNGNLIVNRFGTLTLRNVTLVFMNVQQGEYGIEVRKEGTLNILDLDDDPGTKGDRTIIKPMAPDDQFTFKVQPEAGFLMKNSEVASCGFFSAAAGDTLGLIIQAKGTTVKNTLFRDCYNGITIQGESTTIVGCEIKDSRNDGIHTTSSNSIIQDCSVTDSKNFGIYSTSPNTTIQDCRITGGQSNGIYSSAGSANILDCVVENTNSTGIYISGSGSNITNCSFLGNRFDGIYVFGWDIRIVGCNASSNGDSGIELSNAVNCEVRNCELQKNGGEGIYQDWYSKNNEIVNCRVSGSSTGIYLMKDFFGIMNLTDCEVRECSVGIDISGNDFTMRDTVVLDCEIGIRILGSDNLFERCEASSSSTGFFLQSFSHSNTFVDCIAGENFDYNFHSLESSTGNAATRLASDSTILSFIYDNGIAIGHDTDPPPTPANKANITKFLNINNVTAASWINLNVHYSDDDVDDILESTLRLYHFNKQWEEVPGSTVITVGNVVNANITDFSPFTVLGDPNPLERTVENLDTGETFFYIQDAIDSTATKDGHTIKVHPRTYRENVAIYKELDIIGDPLIDASGGVGIWIRAHNVYVENMSITNSTIGVYLYSELGDVRGVTLNNITTDNSINVGIQLQNAHENEIRSCNLSGSKSTGISLLGSNKNTILDCVATGIRGDGLAFANSHDNSVRDSIFSENLGTGVDLENSGGNIFRNIEANGNDKGYHLYHSSDNTLIGCRAIDNDYEGFYIHSTMNGVAHSNALIDCQSISNENGVSISGDRFDVDRGSNFNVVRNCNISGNNWNGIWLWGADFTTIDRSIIIGNDVGIDISYTSSGTVIMNSTIRESNDLDLDLRNDAIDSLSLNTTFDTVQCDESSSLVVRNYLHVRTQDALGNPLVGTDIHVENDGDHVYSTSHFGGKDAPSDANGMVPDILVSDRGYFFSSNPTDIVNDVSVWYSDEELNRIVDMEETHLETFSFRFKIEAVIDSIDPGDAFEGNQVAFRGHGTPAGNIELYVWRSDLDGELYNGTEGNFSRNDLSVGYHTIYLMVRDGQGSWSDEVSTQLSVSDVVPIASIDSILPSPANEGDMITFTGSGTDSLGAIQEYRWTSSLLQLPLDSNATFSLSSLLPGNHTIGLVVRDDEGSWSTMVTVPLYINAPPTAIINSIDPSKEILEGDEVVFVGSGDDPNGSIVAYEWISSVQGIIGNTSTFSSTGLRPGNHTITLRVQDGDGAWSSSTSWVISIIGKIPPETDDWFLIEIDEDDDDELKISVSLTSLGRQHLGDIAWVELSIDSKPMDRKILFDSRQPYYEPELRGEVLFSADELTSTRSEFSLNGTLKSLVLPNDLYTLRVEAFLKYPPTFSAPPTVINATEKEVLLEHPRNTLVPILGGAGIGIALSGAGELLRGKGGAAAEGAAIEGEAKPFRLRSKIKRKLLKKNHLLTMLSFVIAVTCLVVAFGYSMMISPTRDPRHNYELLDSVVLSARSTFFGDLAVMLPYLMAVMGAIILFRLWVDWLASKAQGIETAFRPHVSGIISLALSTMFFGTPYGYPAQSIHDSQTGYGLKEARIAAARIIGLLALLLPFWAAWQYFESYRFFNELGLWLVLMCAFTISLPLGDSEGKMVWLKNKNMGLFLLALTAGIYFGWQLHYLPNIALPIIGGGAAIILPLFLMPAPLEGTVGESIEQPLEQPMESIESFSPPPGVPAMIPSCDFCGNPIHENAVPCPICSSPMHDIDPKALYAFFMENMKNTDPRVRSATLTAMAPYLMKHGDLQSMVEGALGDTDGLVRQAALRTLAPLLGEQGELAGVAANLIHDAFPIVRQAAIEVLTPYLGTNDFLFPAFQRNLFDMDEHVRGTAIQALAPFLPQHEELLDDFRNLMGDNLESVRSIAMGAVSPLFSGNPWLKDLLFSRKEEILEEPSPVPEVPKIPSRICPGCGQPMEIGWRSCPFCSNGADTGPRFSQNFSGGAGQLVPDIDVTEEYLRRATSILGFNLARNFGGNSIDGGNAVVLTDFEGEELVAHTGDMGLQWVGSGLSISLPVDSSRSGRDVLDIFVSPNLTEEAAAANVSIGGGREVLDRWGNTLQQSVWNAALDSIEQGELDVGDGSGFVSPPGMTGSGWSDASSSIGQATGNMYRISGFVLGS